MPVEERREPIHGGLTAAPCRRHPRQAHPAPFFILKLGIAAFLLSIDLSVHFDRRAITAFKILLRET